MKEEEEKSPIPFVSNNCFDDQNGELDQISYFLRKPEILKMHLEILYKSVNFINEQSIKASLDEYNAKKERLRLEEEQRQHDTKSKKKQRARSAKDEQPTSNRQNGSPNQEEPKKVEKAAQKKEEIKPKQ